MDKYQNYITRSLLKIEASISPFQDKNSLTKFMFDGSKIEVEQNENYHIDKYDLEITHPLLDNVYLISDDIKTEGKQNDEETFIVTLDFNNKSEKLYINLKGGLVDTIEIPIIWIDADKNKRDEKIKEEERKCLEKIVDLNISRGDTFVNILFNPINEIFKYAKVFLYKKGKDGIKRYLDTYMVPTGKTYFTIDKLAFGDYLLELKQYDELDKVIYASDLTMFTLNDWISDIAMLRHRPLR